MELNKKEKAAVLKALDLLCSRQSFFDCFHCPLRYEGKDGKAGCYGDDILQKFKNKSEVEK